ncbi:S41 family peptidase [Dokdonella soli]|uniref:S41 family peptidase n=1 Tax=Dokdonella soli TaxID=529810 RepID=A0ABP3TWN2_9GAMM
MLHTTPRRLLRHGCCLLCALLPLSAAIAQSIPGGPAQADMTVDTTQRDHVVEALIQALNQGYVFPEQARKIEQSLRAHRRHGDYDKLSSAEKLAATLTEQLRGETNDQHLLVVYSEPEIPEQDANHKPSAEEQAEELAAMKSHNFGIERVERLPFNIGYLDLRAFAPPKEAAGAIAAAMTLLSNTQSLIIDLRRNGGGEPPTVALIASYLLDERTHLNDIYYREGNRTEQMWSADFVAGSRYGQTKDVYLLTSKNTFSAAEDLSYTLKNLKRATLVGETTGGGAHPGDFVRIDAHFSVFVPNGRSISPITHTDWEGKGVTPDLAVPAEDACKTAQMAILKKLLGSEHNPRSVARLKDRIAKVEQENTAGSMDQ